MNYEAFEYQELNPANIPNTGPYQADDNVCNAFEYLNTQTLLSDSQLAWLITHGSVFSQIAQWVLTNMPLNASQNQMLSTYISMSQNEQTNLGWSAFMDLYTKVMALKVQLGLNQGEVEFLLENQVFAGQIDNFLEAHPNDEAAEEHANYHLDKLISDVKYKEFVLASFNWPPIIWEIAKELIGDKIVDIIFRFLPGFGQADNVKDAIKALNNGDWLDFTYNIGQILVSNTPLGQLLKAWEAVDEVHDLYKLVDKIWDKIGNLSSAAIENLWNIAKKSPLKFNANYLKYVDDLKVPKFGYATTTNHLTNFDNAFGAELRQNTSMQVHHAVPQVVLNKYPNLGISPYQMHSLENLRGIPNDVFTPGNPSLKLHDYLTHYVWKPWYDLNPNASLNQIFNKAKEIDDLYGHLFVPPIR